MFPELFSLGPVTVYTYGVVLAAAYLLGLPLAMRRAKARGMDPNRALDLGIAIIVSALVGAKLLLVLVDFDHFRRNPGEQQQLTIGGTQVELPLAGALRLCTRIPGDATLLKRLFDRFVNFVAAFLDAGADRGV